MKDTRRPWPARARWSIARTPAGSFRFRLLPNGQAEIRADDTTADYVTQAAAKYDITPASMLKVLLFGSLQLRGQKPENLDRIILAAAMAGNEEATAIFWRSRIGRLSAQHRALLEAVEPGSPAFHRIAQAEAPRFTHRNN